MATEQDDDAAGGRRFLALMRDQSRRAHEFDRELRLLRRQEGGEVVPLRPIAAPVVPPQRQVG